MNAFLKGLGYGVALTPFVVIGGLLAVILGAGVGVILKVLLL